MPRRPAFIALLLICAAGLAAMCAGHALVGTLGDSFGYAHTIQAPAIEFAAALAAFGIAFLARRIVIVATGSTHAAHDWAPEAMNVIRAMGPARLVAVVVAVQAAALVGGESIEQRAAGVTVSGFAALVGSPLAIAPLVHLVVGLLAAILLFSFAKGACENAVALIALIRGALEWLARTDPVSTGGRVASTFDFTAERVPLARKLASRPPPASIRLA